MLVFFIICSIGNEFQFYSKWKIQAAWIYTFPKEFTYNVIVKCFHVVVFSSINLNRIFGFKRYNNSKVNWTFFEKFLRDTIGACYAVFYCPILTWPLAEKIVRHPNVRWQRSTKHFLHCISIKCIRIPLKFTDNCLSPLHELCFVYCESMNIQFAKIAFTCEAIIQIIFSNLFHISEIQSLQNYWIFSSLRLHFFHWESSNSY